MRRIQTKNRKIGTYEIDKISLSCFDDKKFILNDEIHTLGYFHKDSKKKNLEKDYYDKNNIHCIQKCIHCVFRS